MKIIEEFPATWEDRKAELERWYAALEPVELAGLDEAELATYFEDAWTFLRRAWEIHFELMYPLVANFVGFSGLWGAPTRFPPGKSPEAGPSSTADFRRIVRCPTYCPILPGHAQDQRLPR